MKKSLLFFCAVMIITVNCSGDRQAWSEDSHIRPWVKNSSYWQYNGKPVLLLGATSNDNPFQNKNLKTHLDSLKGAGGNVIRNTMSDRDPGDEHAFFRNPDGKYDLNKWNEEYWRRFEYMLQLTWEREIIVQIEVWDRFDHSRDQWKTDPFNPANNINYTFEESGLDSIYPLHPGQNAQPFFFTVPDLKNNGVVLKYQQMFVEKLLTVSQNYDNVLYCIDNETSGNEEWATFWTGFIKSHSEGKDIYITEMWDQWDVKSATHKRTLDHPERYGFIDISQNSQIAGPDNWSNAQYVFEYIKDNPRPVNSTKIYGSDNGPWLNRGINTKHAVNTFFRNILGGFASSRFHRPPAGEGLSEVSINCIKTMRQIETHVRFWDIEPSMHLLRNNGGSEVYLAAEEGLSYVLFFPESGSVKLDLTGHDRNFVMRWIDIQDAEWKEEKKIKGGSVIDVTTQNKNGSLAVITRK